ncbi:MAG: hypothetical protein ABIG93_02895 [archaeon]|nr:hypothetical protein [Nanoarchaeota archaeon]
MLKELLKSLENSDVFLDWKKAHFKAYLSHFFVQVSSDLEIKAAWEIGYYNPEDEKVSTFSLDDDNEFFLKDSDDVFKKDESKVEKLKLNDVKLVYNEATDKFRKLVLKEFPSVMSMLGDGFVILQNIKGQNTWNLTLVTQKLTMVNIKIDTDKGKLIKKDEINFLYPGQSKAS